MSCSVTFRPCSAEGKVGCCGQLELPLWSTQPRCRRCCCWHVESQQLRFPTSSLPAFLANTCAGGSGPRLSASLCVGGSQQPAEPAEPATAESQKTKMPWTPQHSASWLDHFGKQRSGALQALKLVKLDSLCLHFHALSGVPAEATLTLIDVWLRARYCDTQD